MLCGNVRQSYSYKVGILIILQTYIYHCIYSLQMSQSLPSNSACVQSVLCTKSLPIKAIIELLFGQNVLEKVCYYQEYIHSISNK